MDKIYILHGPSQIMTVAKRKCFRAGESEKVMVHRDTNTGMVLSWTFAYALLERGDLFRLTGSPPPGDRAQ
jgi:hypothetical protein